MFIKSIFAGIHEARKGKLPKFQYENLEYTPYLYGSDHMFHLYDHADAEQKMKIYDYLNGEFDMEKDVSSIGKYKALCMLIKDDLDQGQRESDVPKTHMKKMDVYLDDFKGDW